MTNHWKLKKITCDKETKETCIDVLIMKLQNLYSNDKLVINTQLCD